ARELVAPPPALAAVGVLEADERDAPVPAVQERLRVQEAFVAEVEGRDCPIRASLQGFVEQDAGELLVLVELPDHPSIAAAERRFTGRAVTGSLDLDREYARAGRDRRPFRTGRRFGRGSRRAVEQPE